MQPIIDFIDSINLFYLLAIALLTVYIYSMFKVVELKKDKNVSRETKEITQEQYEQMLSQLMASGVITTYEYNNLLVKGLPYFK
jgi:glutamate-1-semialdehyde aminotransferase